MHLLRRTLSLLTLFLPLTLVLVFGLLALRRFYLTVQGYRVSILQTEVARALGREVKVGSIRIAGRYVYLEDVQVSEKGVPVAAGRIAGARRVVMDFDLRKILLEKDRCVPRFADVWLENPVVHISRDREGRWNFEDLIKPLPERPTRPIAGRIHVVEGTLLYDDEALPRHPKRPATPFQARLTHISGLLRIGPNNVYAWFATAHDADGRLQRAEVNGSYEANKGRLFLKVVADRVDIPRLARRVLPPDTQVAGFASGQLTLVWTPEMRGNVPADLQADFQIEGGTLTSSRLGEPVSNIRGTASLTGVGAEVNLEAEFAGSKLRVAGTIAGLKNPLLRASVKAANLRLQRLLAAAKLQRRFPELRRVQASADLHLQASGPMDNLAISATGPLTVWGHLPDGPILPRPARLQYALSGNAKAPSLRITGILPQVRYDRFTAHNLWLAGVYTGRQAVADFQVQVAGGNVTGRVEIMPQGKQTRYALLARARRVDLARLPQEADRSVGGIVDIDLRAQGQWDKHLPDGMAKVNVYGLKYDKLAFDRVHAFLRSTGDVVRIDPLTVQAATGIATADGYVDIAQKRLNLHFEADQINLSHLPLVELEDRRLPPRGYVYVRDGRVTGSWEDPTVEAMLHAFQLGVEGLAVDYARTHVRGNKTALEIEDGLALRLPASARFSGTIRQLLEEKPQLALTADFNNLEVRDLARLTGSTIAIAGTARGHVQIEGDMAKPYIAISPLTVETASIGFVDFDRMSGALRFDPFQADGTWFLSGFEAMSEKMRVAASASLTSDGRFAIRDVSLDADLDLLKPYVSEYATVKGRIDATGHLEGAFREGEARDLLGSLSLQTTELTLNNQQLGELQGTVDIHGDTLSSNDLALGTREAGIYLAPPASDSLPAFRYDRKQNTFVLDGRVRALTIENLRNLLLQSPYLARTSEKESPEGLEQVFRPFTGALNGVFHVEGPLHNPEAKISWSGEELLFDGQPVQQFTGTALLNRKVLTLEQATLKARDAALTVDGTLVWNQSLFGTLELDNFTLDQLQRWLPGRKELEALKGTVDKIDVQIAGTPSSPELIASLNFSNVQWQDERVLGGRKIAVEDVSIARAVIKEGRIEAQDIQMALRGPQPAFTEATPDTHGEEAPRYEAHASGSIAFSWQTPHFGEDPALNFNISLRNQGLGILTAFVPTATSELDGTINASFTWSGTLKNPVLEGSLEVNADRLRFAGMTTVISDLHAAFALTGDSLRVVRNEQTGQEKVTARLQVINPRNRNAIVTSEPIEMTGDLALRPEVSRPGFRITTERAIFAESPLPLIGSGRAAAELATSDLSVKGTVFEPLIRGTLRVIKPRYIGQADFRMPDPAKEALAGPPLPIKPKFDLKFITEDPVRISATQLAASVRTSTEEPIALTGGLDAPSLTGTLLIEKGTLLFPTARFSIQPGGHVSLRYPYYSVGNFTEPILGVLLNVRATTRLTARSVTGVMRRYTITVEAEGPLYSSAPLQVQTPDEFTPGLPGARGLRLTFTADPPDLALSPAGLERRVIGLLGGQEAIEGLFSQRPDVGTIIGQQLTEVLTGSILPEWFERSGIAGALGLEELTLEYAGLNIGAVRLSGHLTDRLEISYWRRLVGANIPLSDQTWLLKLSYRLGSRTQFSWTRDDRNTNAFLLEGVFRY